MFWLQEGTLRMFWLPGGHFCACFGSQEGTFARVFQQLCTSLIYNHLNRFWSRPGRPRTDPAEFQQTVKLSEAELSCIVLSRFLFRCVGCVEFEIENVSILHDIVPELLLAFPNSLDSILH